MDMFLQVRNVIREHETQWSGITAFGTAVSRFNEELDELIRLSSLQSTTSKGVSIVKDELLAQVTEATLDLARILRAYAKNNKDAELSYIAGISKTDITRAKKLEKIQIISRIVDKVIENAEALIPYGVDSSTIEQTLAAKERLEQAIHEPRTTIIKRASFTIAVVEKQVFISGILKDNIDAFVFAMRKSNPEFFNKYTAARKVIDYVHHRPSTEERPPEPDDGFAP